mmetsp:Transcript_5771/g.11270  ORF Transcript_5771/g.11270 Transcript_5771/m.11270 type:complete len:86 (-) Transcript_5771:375-632(-)
MNLFFFFITASSLCALACYTSWTSLSKWRSECEVNVFFSVGTNHERWNINQSLSNTDVSLADKNASVVDGLCKTLFENLCLKSSF